MKRVMKWILIVAGVLVLGCVGIALIVPRETIVTTPPAVAATTPTAAIASVSSASPTAGAPQATATQSTAKPTAAPAPTVAPTAQPIGTRLNPVPKGEPYTFRKGNQVFTVQVLEAQRNALAGVKKANRFNDDPPEGEDYILIKLRLAYSQGGQDKPMTTTNGEHRFYADNRFFGAPVSSVPPKPEFSGQDLFPGATIDGWLAGKHLPKALMEQAVLVYDSVYFAL